jgi:predicted Zn-dependent protease with MMP-like domain
MPPRPPIAPAASAPSLDDIEALARAAIDALPSEFRAAAASVALRVEDFASDDVLDDMDVEDPFDLTGLYDGIPLPEKSVMDQPDRPDTIWLFRRPILDEWVGRGDVPLGELVTHVYVHELAHHLGWSDADIASVDRWWE